MRTDTLAARMRRLEAFHTLRVPDGAWTILRVDGHGFTRLTAQHFEKPFDDGFSAAMIGAAQALIERFQGHYAYTQSDEISLLLPRDSRIFDREVEKLLSLTAGTASSAFSLATERLAVFDSRVIVASRTSQVIDYFRWRQSDAGRCALNGWCYWTLRKAGLSQATATARLHGSSRAEKLDLLALHGIRFEDLPASQRRGVGILRQSYEKSAVNLRSGAPVIARRQRLHVERELPDKEDYATWFHALLAEDSR